MFAAGSGISRHHHLASIPNLLQSINCLARLIRRHIPSIIGLSLATNFVYSWELVFARRLRPQTIITA